MPRSRCDLRFAVGSANGPRSGVWRLWLPRHGQDIYCGLRSIAHRFKVSLHGNGRCHAALQSDIADDYPGGVPNRFLKVWEAPEVEPGLSLPFRLCIPSTQLDIAPIVEKPSRPITWLQPPAPGFALHIDFVITAPGAMDPEEWGWPGCMTGEVDLLWDHPLATGAHFWLVSASHQMPEWFAASLSKRINEARPIALEPGQPTTGARLILSASDVDYSATFFIDAAYRQVTV